MKNLFTLFLLAAIGQQLALAQPPGRQDRVEALKVSFISNRLHLTPEEAQKFWPVFNQYEAELNTVRKEKRQHSSQHRDWPTLPDAEVRQHINRLLELEQQEMDLKKKYTNELFNAVPAYKVALLYQAVEDFKVWLINQAKNRRDRTPGGRF